MTYLLLPEDEREMVENFCVDRGWNLLDGSVERGQPLVIRDPRTLLSEDLPKHGEAVGPIRVYLFWSPEWGRAVSVGDAPEPADLVRRVIRQRFGGESGRLDLIDPHATPVMIYRRCFWMPDARLALGRLQGMDRPRREWPPPFRRAFGQAERWLKRGAVKVSPFDHDDEPGGVPGVVTWVRPAAWSWIRSGGRVSTISF